VAADEEDEVLRLLLGPIDDPYETGGIRAATRRVEKDFVSRGVAGKQIEALGHDLAHLTSSVAAGALEELGGYGVGVLVARLADEVQEEFHGDGAFQSAAFRVVPAASVLLQTTYRQDIVLGT
jgi:hypothetical protein